MVLTLSPDFDLIFTTGWSPLNNTDLRERFHEPRVNEKTLCGDRYSTWTSKVPLAKRASSNHRVLVDHDHDLGTRADLVFSFKRGWASGALRLYCFLSACIAAQPYRRRETSFSKHGYATKETSNRVGSWCDAPKGSYRRQKMSGHLSAVLGAGPR